MTAKNLFELPIGKSAYIQTLDAEGSIRRRLLDIGLTQGTVTKCLYEAPSGDPKAYLIRGAVIALREEDAALIRIRPMTAEKEREVWD